LKQYFRKILARHYGKINYEGDHLKVFDEYCPTEYIKARKKAFSRDLLYPLYIYTKKVFYTFFQEA
jgi:hypothetical protein